MSVVLIVSSMIVITQGERSDAGQHSQYPESEPRLLNLCGNQDFASRRLDIVRLYLNHTFLLTR